MAVKKITVFGGTGLMGLLFCQKAVKNGHSLTIYARNPSKIPDDLNSNALVKVVKGEVDDASAIASVIAEHDLVVSFLGPTTLSSKVPPSVFTDAYKNIFAGMREHGLKRIIAVGTPYIHDNRDKATIQSRIGTAFVRTIGPGVYNAFQEIGKVFDEHAQDLDWTIVRIGYLLNKAQPIGVGWVGEKGWTGQTSRDSAAAWMAEFVGKDMTEYVKQKPGLYSK